MRRIKLMTSVPAALPSARPVDQPDNVAPDYKTQASALLYGDPYDWNNLNQPDSIADYLRTYY
jgi:hypothetical protein